jgi:hypothetical protein
MPPKLTHAKTTATREYFGTEAATDDPEDHDIAWPSSPSSSPAPKSKESDEEQPAPPPPPPSPTPSEIVLSAELDDVVELGELNRRMMGDGVEVEDRKRLLVKKMEELAKKRKREEMEMEEEKVKGKGKKKEEK